ncbi:preprotein translocase subunit YajC [bacterium]|jgi:preprotein translocase YajC subunit|nr:preprotein translocase subunit YajC [bacterium]
MELSSWVMLAVEEAAKGAAPNPFSTLWLPIVASIAVVLILNPFGKKEDKKQKQLIESLKKNDRVLLIGGIYGRIVLVKPDDDEVVVKVDEDRDLKLTVTKSAVLRKIEKGEEVPAKPTS